MGWKMLASKSWHFLSHFQSENGNEYSRWTVKEVFPLIVPGATDGHDVGCQRQLTVYDDTEITSGVRDGDASAEHQDIMAVNLVQQLT